MIRETRVLVCDWCKLEEPIPATALLGPWGDQVHASKYDLLDLCPDCVKARDEAIASAKETRGQTNQP